MSTAEFVTTQIRHGPACLDDGIWRWNIWAPRSESAHIVIYDRGTIAVEMPMRPLGCGLFTSAPARVYDGQRYGIRLEQGPVRPDPATRWQPDGIHRPSAIWFPDRFPWSDQDWTGVPRHELVIYELHVGTFTRAGTFDAIIPRLEELRELGVNAIELMPIAQFPGNRNWGYDGVHPFAVQNTYGGPHGLQRFVNACHQADFSVILDVVYNHLGPEGNYLAEFGPYATQQYQTPWGAATNFDQPGCEGVRAFVLENVRYWIREFHLDGLRLDAVHTVHDSSPRHIVREIKDVAEEESIHAGRPIHLIAESDLNDVTLMEDAPDYGLGLDAVWNDDFHHSVHALLTGERHGYYADFGTPGHLAKALNQTFVYDGCYSVHRGHEHGTRADHFPGDRFVACLQNHDQVGNRVDGDRIATLLTPAQQRLAAGLLLLGPHVPLIFMGEEYGESRPFPYFCSFQDSDLVNAIRRGRCHEHAQFEPHVDVADPQVESTFERAALQWSWPGESHAGGLRRLYHDLLACRRHWPALRDFHRRRAELIPGPLSPRILRFIRGATSYREPGALVAYFNLTADEQHPECSCHHDAVLLLSSEASRYRGGRRPAGAVDSLLPYEFQVYGPNSWKRP